MSGGDARAARRWRNLLGLLARPRPEVGATPADVVHREGPWRLLRYRAAAGGPRFATPVLLVPSLINRHYVLDLSPGKSFVEWLVARGHDVWLLEWGNPRDEDRFATFDDVCDRWIGRAVRLAARASGRGKVHVLGYCLGGTLAAIHVAARPSHVATLTALAAPVRFSDDGLLSVWTRSPAFDVGTVVDALGNVPPWLTQPAFLMLRPTLQLAKTVHMIDRAWDDELLDGFLALEHWGWDNVAFPGEAYRRYVDELYRRDALASGTFTLSGSRVDLGAITCPTLAITFEHDNIVPAASAAVLLERIGSTDKQRLHLPGGHVGAVVARKASQGLWPAIASFWEARDEDPKPARPVKREARPTRSKRTRAPNHAASGSR